MLNKMFPLFTLIGLGGFLQVALLNNEEVYRSNLQQSGGVTVMTVHHPLGRTHKVSIYSFIVPANGELV
jgi:hypothetical protein